MNGIVGTTGPTFRGRSALLPTQSTSYDHRMTSIDLETISVESRAATFGAMSDPIRLSILDQLTEDQRCVCDLQETLEIAPNLLSYHLRILREAGLVESARRGRWVDYRIAENAAALVAAALPQQIIGEMSG